jgi:hypothetical protein
MKATVAAMEAGAYYRAMWSIPILTHLHGKCGADNRKEFDAAMAVMVAGEPGAKNKAKASEAPPRQPMFCDTKPRALGGSTTDCF